MLLNINFSKMFIKIINLNYLNDKQHTYSNTDVIIISVILQVFLYPIRLMKLKSLLLSKYSYYNKSLSTAVF